MRLGGVMALETNQRAVSSLLYSAPVRVTSHRQTTNKKYKNARQHPTRKNMQFAYDNIRRIAYYMYGFFPASIVPSYASHTHTHLLVHRGTVASKSAKLVVHRDRVRLLCGSAARTIFFDLAEL